jgi:cap1 methyltransferase
MMESKRRRSNHSVSSSQTIATDHRSRDCFAEVYPTPTHASITQIRSSWLYDTSWFDKDWSLPIDEDELTLQEEVVALNNQLLQVKRRLAPAAERCTKACNASANESITTGHGEFIEARRVCNPYEVLGEGRDGGLNTMFINRSAVKLVNIDAILDFSLIQANGCSANLPFVFVDLCGAPGGFSEYIFRRCESMQVAACQGYGMSLIGANEHGRGARWRLRDESSFRNGCHFSYCICTGADGTGDIYSWDNVESLQQMIQGSSPFAGTRSTPTSSNECKKAHLVVADGGFDAQRDNEHQEEVAQKLVVCEATAALAILRPGGTLLLKMFGFQTSVIRCMMTELSQLFDHIITLKPISSRPASAERYVIFCGFHGVESNWNGPRWRDRVFLGGTHVREFGLSSMSSSTAISRYMSMMDRDMLALNLKACFAILSYLESKCQGMDAQGEYQHFESSNADCVDVEIYQIAWRLR